MIDNGYTVTNDYIQFTADDIIMESFTLATEKYDKYYYVIENTDNAPIHEIIGLSASVFDKSRRGIVNRFDTRNMNLPFYMIYNPGHVEAPNELDYYQLGFYIPENLYIINVYPVK